MRYGLLSDIHGNAFALHAATDTLRAMRVDAWLCLGDIVGYGPQPDECVRDVAALGAHTVLGNHELMVSGELSTERCGALGRRTLPTTRDNLSPAAHRFLASLPSTIELPGVVLTHAALDSPQDYIKQESAARRQLELLRRHHPTAELLLIGHTHQAWAVAEDDGVLEPDANGTVQLPPGQRCLINPGSVGQSRGPERRPRARFALLDVQRREVTFRAATFDLASCRASLAEKGLPYECIHFRRAGLPALRRRARGVWRRAIGAA